MFIEKPVKQLMSRAESDSCYRQLLSFKACSYVMKRIADAAVLARLQCDVYNVLSSANISRVAACFAARRGKCATNKLNNTPLRDTTGNRQVW